MRTLAADDRGHPALRERPLARYQMLEHTPRFFSLGAGFQPVQDIGDAAG
jgi:hypothetical protein